MAKLNWSKNETARRVRMYGSSPIGGAVAPKNTKKKTANKSVKNRTPKKHGKKKSTFAKKIDAGVAARRERELLAYFRRCVSSGVTPTGLSNPNFKRRWEAFMAERSAKERRIATVRNERTKPATDTEMDRNQNWISSTGEV